MADLEELRKQCLASLYLCTDNALKYLDEERDSELELLKNCVREYCAMEAKQGFEAEALVRAKRDIDASNLDSLDEKFNAHFNSLLAQRPPNIDNHPAVREFDKRVRNGLKKPAQNLDESDIAITETQETYVDAITKMLIKDPVRNTMCGHVYERSAILAHIKSRTRVRCPVMGCVNREPMQISHLVEDEEIRLRIAQQSAATNNQSIMDLSEIDSQ
ncbi:E3 SUMO-protein ligase NSE2 [Bicyclus anynana]|uniref:E3 SUMO-protein ligase NSE2 n=1 Tax=Bicyclus anynana TaxID=110368 RepID=A0A6J1MY17_BICAN|nr:E3 SUMO-protein ligase NSE2 [Bicyclus anynana]